MDDIIQQIQRTDTQLRKISALNHISEITSDNEGTINNSYILLTTPGINNFTIRLQSLLDKINDSINDKIINKINEFNNDFDGIISQYYTKNEVNTLVDNNNNRINDIINNLQSSLNTFKTLVNASYYDKDKINLLLDSIRYDLTEYIDTNISSNVSTILSIYDQLRSELNSLKTKLIDNYYTKDEIDSLLNDLKLLSKEYTDSKTQALNQNINNLLSNYYTKSEIDNSINDRHDELYDLFNNIQSALNAYKTQVSVTYYDKDKINSLIDALRYDLTVYIDTNIENYNTELKELSNNIEAFKTETNNNLNNINSELSTFKNEVTDNINDINNELSIFENEVTDNINNLNTELSNNIETFKTEVNDNINNIKNELTNNTNTEFTNSRIDLLEKELNYIKSNIDIDNIDKIIWTDYSIETGISTYIIDINQTITFNIIKGLVTAYYNDETPNNDITNEANYNISTGQLDNNVVTLKYNSVSAGNHSITVNYKNHDAVNTDNTHAAIKFNVTKTKYNNHFWITDSANINKIIADNIFADTNYRYQIASSTGCPFSDTEEYNAESIIRQKFYNNDNSIDISNNALYLILPTAYIDITGDILKINTKILKSNIFEIHIIGLESTFNIHEQANNANGYYKYTEYKVIKISETINSGISLNIK